MSKDLKLSLSQSDKPKVKPYSPLDALNADHIGVEFYVHVPHSTAPMMYYIYDSRDDADTIAKGVGGEVFVRDVSEWRVAP